MATRLKHNELGQRFYKAPMILAPKDGRLRHVLTELPQGRIWQINVLTEIGCWPAPNVTRRRSGRPTVKIPQEFTDCRRFYWVPHTYSENS